MPISGELEEPPFLIRVRLEVSSDGVGSEIPLGVNPSYLGASVFSGNHARRSFTRREDFVDLVDNVISEFLLEDGAAVDVVEEAS